MWVLGIETRLIGRSASTYNHEVIFPIQILIISLEMNCRNNFLKVDYITGED